MMVAEIARASVFLAARRENVPCGTVAEGSPSILWVRGSGDLCDSIPVGGYERFAIASVAQRVP